MTERMSFGAELRRAREHRGMPLDAIAEQTKVSAAYYAGLERGDLSRWPSGIFRRAFVRSYAVAVGLDPEETLARFGRLFPETDDSSPRAEPTSAVTEAHGHAGADPSRLSGARPIAPVARRLFAASIDLSVAAMPGALAAVALGGYWFWPVAAGVGMAGHLTCFAATGTTPGAWLIGRLSAPTPEGVAPPPAERRRVDSDGGPSPARRRNARQAPARSSPRAHRVRH